MSVYFTIAVISALSHSIVSGSCSSPALLMEIAAVVASRAVVDTSRPFQSVREAVEVFGERCVSSRASSECGSRIATGGTPPQASPSPAVLGCLKKLEADLAEARSELARLRQRQSHMEMAVSSISVQLSSGLAIFSGRDKGKELAVVDAVAGAEEDGRGRVCSDRWDESHAEEWMASLEYLPSLSEVLAIKMVEDDQLGERRQRKVKKQQQKKNGISLVGRIFSKKGKSR
ncbi:hypothetical protein GUJ93_ZPchr0006g42195 [Zizania palustris]|uniref:Uncharacterized protein n=1 Tax=Zizania palustris TaxID=103762 RepID=A0A8J5STC3_ZIZPA|nr:hypothetical protein GUJ93_ZPchr0006g42195 [Zizania palustris]